MEHSKKHGQDGRIFLELFSGKGGVSERAKVRGFGAVAVDLNKGKDFDLCDRRVQEIIEGWITSGCVMGCWLGTPCSSWSSARHDLPDGGGPRSKLFIMGKKGLTPADQQRIKLGNLTMSFSAKIIKLTSSLGIPTVLENPSTSLLWQVPRIKKLISQDGRLTTMDYCQFGTPWRKRTFFASWNLDVSLLPEARCRGRGICSRTQRHHLRLTGMDPQSGRPWTLVAEPYPKPLCRVWWSAIETSSANLGLQARTRLALEL